MRPLLALAPLLLLAASHAGFTPGLWQLTSAPGAATLDGKPLGDLPYTAPAAPEQVCATAAELSDPAAWLSRGVAQGCSFSRRQVAGGRVDMAGTCPPQAPGLARGAVRLTGRWTPTRYDLRFTTTNPSENGVMGFTGTMTGRRTGACPARL